MRLYPLNKIPFPQRIVQCTLYILCAPLPPCTLGPGFAACQIRGLGKKLGQELVWSFVAIYSLYTFTKTTICTNGQGRFEGRKQIFCYD
jgi:hypothetical protein